jgi:DNA-binding NtrC family response regulator
MKRTILIVEDQFIEANNLQMILERAGYSVCGIARSVPVALKIIEEEQPGLVLLDIFLQGPLTGIDLAKTLKEKNIGFIYLSANSNKETLEAAKATRPYGFLVKPFREKDVLVTLEIAHYLHEHSLEAIIRNESAMGEPKKNAVAPIPPKVNKLYDADKPQPDNFYGIIGRSKSLQTALRHLQIVAPTETSVLILGESGTGKERIAECVHQLSARKGKVLVKVNCAALPVSLIESVLFGHEKGSFTGATERRIGKFEQGHGGTVFLDEIGEMPLDVQVKFLRVLQEKEVERIGGTSTIKIDVRIIAATNRNLEKEVAEGRFRMDLYYRLNVFPILLPALRERKEDIPVLAHYFAEYYSRKIGRSQVEIPDKIMNDLVAHDWPGNIRELEHAIERSVLLAEGKAISQVKMPEFSLKEETLKEVAAPYQEHKIKTIEENERDHIIQVLRKCNGKVFGKGGAAELLGINASTLNSRIKKLGIEKAMVFKEKDQ